MAAVTICLLRHCSAGRREAWAGDDRLRPLDALGRAQAQALVERVRAAADVRRILCSPFRRCRESVLPLSAALGLPLEITPQLAEDQGDSAADVLRGLAAGDAVLCSHGDVLPLVLRRLAEQDGLSIGPSPRCAKGSMWVLRGPSAARFAEARYLPPPA